MSLGLRRNTSFLSYSMVTLQPVEHPTQIEGVFFNFQTRRLKRNSFSVMARQDKCLPYSLELVGHRAVRISIDGQLMTRLNIPNSLYRISRVNRSQGVQWIHRFLSRATKVPYHANRRPAWNIPFRIYRSEFKRIIREHHSPDWSQIGQSSG
ncbi:MAG: hypothetical protein Ct9H90mP9_4310 [Pseudomonadota bacterium]|nr:MAG: hypothetical protein Ct9H90mP9_4310 [Pseudomonadota bacterium]